MESRNRSLKFLNKLVYIDSLDEEDKAKALSVWVDKYLVDNFLNQLDLDDKGYQQLLELFYKNIIFLQDHVNNIKIELNNHNNIKKFFQ